MTVCEMAEGKGISYDLLGCFNKRFWNEACLNEVYSVTTDTGVESKLFVCSVRITWHAETNVNLFKIITWWNLGLWLRTCNQAAVISMEVCFFAMTENRTASVQKNGNNADCFFNYKVVCNINMKI
jgi:hypothetical protein